jgi:hypothetical protein
MYMIFGKHKSAKMEVNHWMYDTFLFVTLIIKIVYVLSALKNRVDPNDRNQYIMILMQNIFTMLICFLMLYLFHPYSKHPTEIWRDTKIFLFMYAILTLFDIDWNIFLSPVSAVISDERREYNTSRSMAQTRSKIETVAHGLVCNRDSVYSKPVVDVSPLRSFCSHPQIDSGTIAALIVVVIIFVLGAVHKRTHATDHYYSTAYFILAATIGFAFWTH